MSGWRQIETAPIDGTEVLGFGTASYKGRPYANGAHVIWWNGSAWDGRDADDNVSLQLTHWMPLPEPPK